MTFKFEGKNVPHFCFRNVGQFTPKCQGSTSMCTANREKPLPQKSAVSHQVYAHALLVQLL